MRRVIPLCNIFIFQLALRYFVGGVMIIMILINRIPSNLCALPMNMKEKNTERHAQQ